MKPSDKAPSAVGDESAGAAAFTAVAPLYDHLMHDVPYAGWAEYLHEILTVHGAAPKSVLEVACGTGNMAEKLHEEGMRVTGIDIAPGMIAEARRKAAEAGLEIAYHVQDVAELDLPGETFDLCVSLFDSLNYVVDPARLAVGMRRVFEHLRPNGLFVFDLNAEYALRNKFFDQNNVSSDDRLKYDWVSDYDPKTRLCRVVMLFRLTEPDGAVREFEEIHWQFAYREQEICEMLAAAGFTGIATYQAYSLRGTSPTSDRIFYVARRPGTGALTPPLPRPQGG
jgi:ubiquinone/menaquinone biosynthesis C-methylase UbiE